MNEQDCEDVKIKALEAWRNIADISLRYERFAKLMVNGIPLLIAALNFIIIGYLAIREDVLAGAGLTLISSLMLWVLIRALLLGLSRSNGRNCLGGYQVAIDSSFAAFLACFDDVPRKLNQAGSWKLDPEDGRLMTAQVGGVIYECSSLNNPNQVFRHRDGGLASPLPKWYGSLNVLMAEINREFERQHPKPEQVSASKT